MLYIWHIMNLLTIPLAREKCLLACCMVSPLRWDGAEGIGNFGIICEDREGGAARPHFCSTTYCYRGGGQGGTAREQSLGDPQTSFCFGGSGEQKHGLQVLVIVTRADLFWGWNWTNLDNQCLGMALWFNFYVIGKEKKIWNTLQNFDGVKNQVMKMSFLSCTELSVLKI